VTSRSQWQWLEDVFLNGRSHMSGNLTLV
jgi:hypothetical protein